MDGVQLREVWGFKRFKMSSRLICLRGLSGLEGLRGLRGARGLRGLSGLKG